MTSPRALLAVLAAACLLLATTPSRAASCVLEARVEGVVSSGLADYVAQAIGEADERCEALLLHIDTPGGHLSATRTMVRHILDAPVPVITYVAPAGARAGSAGVFIAMAGHVAAMAPGTNIGAAHPVTGRGGDPEEQGEHISRKIENDTAAFARAIAERRGRDVAWAERAVRESVSATAREALELGVVDRLAEDDRSLLVALDGWSVDTLDGASRLSLADARIEPFEMTLQQRVRQTLGHPNLAYLLLMLGMLGVVVEVGQPGLVVPGALGALCLLLAAVGLDALSVDVGGAILMAVGVGLLLAELFVTSYGLLAVGGLGALVVGSLLLIDLSDPEFFAEPSVALSWGAVVPTAVLLAGAAAALAWRLGKSRARAPVTGAGGLVGERGVALSEVDEGGGRVQVHGERWQAVASEKLAEGTPVHVVRVEDLSLVVEPTEMKGTTA